MKLGLVSALTCILTLSACATVDIADMTTSGQMDRQSKAITENVVIRSTDQLFSVFSEKGWAGPSIKETVAQATTTLLKGRPKAQSQTEKSETDSIQRSQQLEKDIKLASQHINQTLKAADIYLTMAEEGADLRRELQQLEKAVITCRKSEIYFKKGADQIEGLSLKDELLKLEQDIRALGDVTDIYGGQVRALNSPAPKTAS